MRSARHVHHLTAMFEYVKNHEIEQRRKMTIYGALLVVAMILVITAIIFAYA